MASSLNLSLTDELRAYVDSRTGDRGVYSTPSEYLRDLIRKDMRDQMVVSEVVSGIKDIKEGKLSDKSIMDIFNEDS